MLKLAGAALIGAVCVYIGFRQAGLLHRRVRTLHAFIGMTGQIRQEIRHLTALPELISRLKRDRPDSDRGASDREVMERFLGRIEEEWKKEDYLGFSRAWRTALAPLELTEEDKLVLAEVGNALGRFDAETQVAALDRTLSALERQQEAARSLEQKNAKLYRTLGLTAGVMAVILIL